MVMIVAAMVSQENRELDNQCIVTMLDMVDPVCVVATVLDADTHRNVGVVFHHACQPIHSLGKIDFRSVQCKAVFLDAVMPDTGPPSMVHLINQ